MTYPNYTNIVRKIKKIIGTNCIIVQHSGVATSVYVCTSVCTSRYVCPWRSVTYSPWSAAPPPSRRSSWPTVSGGSTSSHSGARIGNIYTYKLIFEKIPLPKNV